MKTIIRTKGDEDIVDIIAEDKKESDRLKVWCYNNNPNVDNLNIWCEPIEKGTWVRDDFRKVNFKFGSKETDGRVYDFKDRLVSCIYESVRPLYEDEIKDYLIKEAIKEGFVGYRKFKWIDEPAIDSNMILPNCGFEYLPDVDALTVGVAESPTRRAIYKNGRWATVVYDDPPKSVLITESTLYNLVRDFATRFYASDYLDDRDFEVLKFLKSKGYLK